MKQNKTNLDLLKEQAQSHCSQWNTDTSSTPGQEGHNVQLVDRESNYTFTFGNMTTSGHYTIPYQQAEL